MAEEFDRVVRKPLLEYVPPWIKPNHLTALRAMLLLPLVALKDYPVIAVTIVLLSSLCDLLDGPLARVRGQVSQTGAIFDATMDKVFILGAFCFACSEAVPGDLVIVIIVLDVLLTVARPFKRLIKVKADANPWGAAKVWTQTAAICIDLMRNSWTGRMLLPSMLYLAIFFALCSLCEHANDMVKS